ncbi:MAG: sigma-E processing peptidase SpoIIGA, partial [Oscillospiraceae bacterium]
MLALWWFAAPFDMIIKNGSTYFNIPIIWLAVLTIAGYTTALLIRRISIRQGGKRGVFPVIIRIGSRSCSIQAFADTGCRLYDVFTGTPVMVCAADAITEILPQNVTDYLAGKSTEAIRLVPCRTIFAEGLIPVFKADEIIIGGKKADILIGVSVGDMGEHKCVFNPEIF